MTHSGATWPPYVPSPGDWGSPSVVAATNKPSRTLTRSALPVTCRCHSPALCGLTQSRPCPSLYQPHGRGILSGPIDVAATWTRNLESGGPRSSYRDGETVTCLSPRAERHQPNLAALTRDMIGRHTCAAVLAVGALSVVATDKPSSTRSRSTSARNLPMHHRPALDCARYSISNGFLCRDYDVQQVTNTTSTPKTWGLLYQADSAQRTTRCRIIGRWGSPVARFLS